MKRMLILLLVLCLCLCGCKKENQRTDIPGGETAPEGVDWRNWEQYAPYTIAMGEETVNVLVGMDEIHLAVYYDQEEQELLGSITILTPLSDVDYSKMRLRIMDVNGDGYDDVSIPDMLSNGDRTIDCWVWDPTAEGYLYAPEYSKVQSDIGADISWREGKNLVSGTRDTPDGGEGLLVWLEEQTLHIYLDKREETLLDQVKIPEPLSPEALSEARFHSFWECRDMNGDGWGDLQLPYRWEETENGVCAYAYCWLWDSESGHFVLDKELSSNPMM